MFHNAADGSAQRFREIKPCICKKEKSQAKVNLPEMGSRAAFAAIGKPALDIDFEYTAHPLHIQYIRGNEKSAFSECLSSAFLSVIGSFYE